MLAVRVSAASSGELEQQLSLDQQPLLQQHPQGFATGQPWQITALSVINDSVSARWIKQMCCQHLCACCLYIRRPDCMQPAYNLLVPLNFYSNSLCCCCCCVAFADKVDCVSNSIRSAAVAA